MSLLAEVLGGGLGSAMALAGTPGAMAVLTAVVAAGLCLALAVLLRADTAVPAHALNPAAVRRRAERTIFLALQDPAGAGRPRPRAPAAHRRVA